MESDDREEILHYRMEDDEEEEEEEPAGEVRAVQHVKTTSNAEESSSSSVTSTDSDDNLPLDEDVDRLVTGNNGDPRSQRHPVDDDNKKTAEGFMDFTRTTTSTSAVEEQCDPHLRGAGEDESDMATDDVPRAVKCNLFHPSTATDGREKEANFLETAENNALEGGNAAVTEMNTETRSAHFSPERMPAANHQQWDESSSLQSQEDEDQAEREKEVNTESVSQIVQLHHLPAENKNADQHSSHSSLNESHLHEEMDHVPETQEHLQDEEMAVTELNRNLEMYVCEEEDGLQERVAETIDVATSIAAQHSAPPSSLVELEPSHNLQMNVYEKDEGLQDRVEETIEVAASITEQNCALPSSFSGTNFHLKMDVYEKEEELPDGVDETIEVATSIAAQHSAPPSSIVEPNHNFEMDADEKEEGHLDKMEKTIEVVQHSAPPSSFVELEQNDETGAFQEKDRVNETVEVATAVAAQHYTPSHSSSEPNHNVDIDLREKEDDSDRRPPSTTFASLPPREDSAFIEDSLLVDGEDGDASRIPPSDTLMSFGRESSHSDDDVLEAVAEGRPTYHKAATLPVASRAPEEEDEQEDAAITRLPRRRSHEQLSELTRNTSRLPNIPLSQSFHMDFNSKLRDIDEALKLAECLHKHVVDDDDQFPESVTPIKVEHSLRDSGYNIPFIDDEAFYYQDWYVTEDHRWSRLEPSPFWSHSRNNGFFSGIAEPELSTATSSPVKANPTPGATPKVQLVPVESISSNKADLPSINNNGNKRKRGFKSLFGCVAR